MSDLTTTIAFYMNRARRNTLIAGKKAGEIQLNISCTLRLDAEPTDDGAVQATPKYTITHYHYGNYESSLEVNGVDLDDCIEELIRRIDRDNRQLQLTHQAAVD